MTPFMTDELIGNYFEKQRSGRSGMRVPLLDPAFYRRKWERMTGGEDGRAVGPKSSILRKIKCEGEE